MFPFFFRLRVVFINTRYATQLFLQTFTGKKDKIKNKNKITK